MVQELMAMKVKIWMVDIDFALPKFYSKVKVLTDKTYAYLRVCLEDKQALECLFQFWNNEDHCKIKQKMDGLNYVVANVYVLPLWCED